MLILKFGDTANSPHMVDGAVAFHVEALGVELLQVSEPNSLADPVTIATLIVAPSFFLGWQTRTGRRNSRRQLRTACK